MSAIQPVHESGLQPGRIWKLRSLQQIQDSLPGVYDQCFSARGDGYFDHWCIVLEYDRARGTAQVFAVRSLIISIFSCLLTRLQVTSTIRHIWPRQLFIPIDHSPDPPRLGPTLYTAAGNGSWKKISYVLLNHIIVPRAALEPRGRKPKKLRSDSLKLLRGLWEIASIERPRSFDWDAAFAQVVRGTSADAEPGLTPVRVWAESTPQTVTVASETLRTGTQKSAGYRVPTHAEPGLYARSASASEIDEYATFEVYDQLRHLQDQRYLPGSWPIATDRTPLLPREGTRVNLQGPPEEKANLWFYRMGVFCASGIILMSALKYFGKLDF